MNDDYVARDTYYRVMRFKNRIEEEISLATMFEVGPATRIRSAYEEHIYEVLRLNDYE